MVLDSKPATLSLVTRSSVLSSVRQIPRADWDRIFGDLAEGYDFFGTLEESGLSDFEFYYICLYREERLELIAPVFSSVFDLGIGVEGWTRTALHLVRRVHAGFLKERTLFCGSPFGEQGVLGLAGDSLSPSALMHELVRTMHRVCAEKNLRFILFKDFPDSAGASMDPLQKMGFFKGESFPNVVLPLPYQTMEDYLASLSYGCRKDLRRKVRKTLSTGEIEVRVVEGVVEIMEDIYALYLQTYEAGEVRFEKLTREYFLAVSQGRCGPAKFFLFYAKGKLACFNLCFCYDGRLIDKFIGFDYSVSRDLNLYFYTWYHNVEWCIKQGLREYQVGQTDHAVKVRLGGTLRPLSFYAKHNNGLINTVLRSAARFLVPRG